MGATVLSTTWTLCLLLGLAWIVLFVTTTIGLVFSLKTRPKPEHGAIVRDYARRHRMLLPIPVVAFLVVFVMPLLVLNWPCFRTREIDVRASHDGALRLSIGTRPTFPRLDLFDPETAFVFRLLDRDGRRLDVATVVLHEDSDFDDPDATWRGDTVQVAGFDSRQPRGLTLSASPTASR